MIDKIISALESMQEDLEEHGELQKARGVSSAIWLIEFMKDFADRKTEPQSNARKFLGYACETCKHRDEEWDSEACDGCCENNDHYEKDEPKIAGKHTKQIIIDEAVTEPSPCIFVKGVGWKGQIDTEPQRNMAEDIVESFGFKAESYRQAKAKDEPQTDCLEQFRVGLEYHTDTTHFGKVKGENITTNKVKTEPQTEKPKIRKRSDKPFRAVWLDDDHNEIGTTQTERAETMSCQECKWWFTDSLKHGGYCQSLLYNHECRYEPEVDCSWK